MRNSWRATALVAFFGLCLACLFGSSPAAAETGESLRVATFSCNATPPLGEPLISCDRIGMVEQPLLAKGIVLEADGRRYVLCVIDWCELCNGGHEAFRNTIAAAANTVPAHVALQTVHQHTAPVVDMDAQKLLAEAGIAELMMNPRVFEVIGQRLADAVRQSLDHLEPFDQVGVGQAKVDRVAATRRPLDANGKISPRMSSCADPAVQALPEGAIDPYLKTITLAKGDKPLVRLHYYATHPQTKYGNGRASSDFVGDVREQVQQKEGVFQIYFNGCGGDITVGKYSDGSRKDRDGLTERLLAGMEAAIAATKYAPASQVRWRVCPVLFPRRTDANFAPAECLACMKNAAAGPVARMYSGGVRSAFHQRSQKTIELTSLEIGNVSIVHLPGEPMIEFQLFAQNVKPGAFVAVAGYGDCGTGYICPEKAYSEGGYEPTASAVKPESETLLKKAISALLGVE